MDQFEDPKRISKTKLLDVAEKLKPVLGPLGYSFVWESDAIASGGPFANGFFKKDGIQIGLIWRELSGLGDIVYENGKFAVDHNDIMEQFKLSKQQKFIFDRKSWKTYSRDGSDVIDAVISDIKLLIDDFLATDKVIITQVLKGAHKIRQKKFPWQ